MPRDEDDATPRRTELRRELAEVAHLLATALRAQHDLGVDSAPATPDDWPRPSRLGLDHIDWDVSEGRKALPPEMRDDAAPPPPSSTAVARRAAPPPSSTLVEKKTKKRPALASVSGGRSLSGMFKGLVKDAITEPLATVPEVERADSLDAIRARIGDCTRCGLCKTRRRVVFGAGDARARLVIVGSFPRQAEDSKGEPFVGEDGLLLEKILSAGMGLTRDQVYLCDVVKCAPPDRVPTPEEIATCRPFLIEQLEFIRPEVIMTLGSLPAQTLLQDGTPIMRLRGTWREYRGTPVMPTLHPRRLLRMEDPRQLKQLVWKDVQAVMERLGMR